MAFGGWNDACDAATDVIGHLADLYGARPVTEVGPGGYYDLQTHRPLVSIDASGRRVVSWPTTEILVAEHPSMELVLVRGPEPTFRWPEFCAELLEAVEPFGPKLAVALGAVAAAIPHTRDLPVRTFAQDLEVARQHDVQVTAHEGYTGITGIAADACDDAGIPALRAWVSVPDYVSTPPSPKATLALLQELSRLLDIDLDPGDLPERAVAWSRELDELAEATGLDERIARLQAEPTHPLETAGDTLADEILGFLRRRPL